MIGTVIPNNNRFLIDLHEKSFGLILGINPVSPPSPLANRSVALARDLSRWYESIPGIMLPFEKGKKGYNFLATTRSPKIPSAQHGRNIDPAAFVVGIVVTGDGTGGGAMVVVAAGVAGVVPDVEAGADAAIPWFT